MRSGEVRLECPNGTQFWFFVSSHTVCPWVTWDFLWARCTRWTVIAWVTWSNWGISSRLRAMETSCTVPTFTDLLVCWRRANGTYVNVRSQPGILKQMHQSTRLKLIKNWQFILLIAVPIKSKRHTLIIINNLRRHIMGITLVKQTCVISKCSKRTIHWFTSSFRTIMTNWTDIGINTLIRGSAGCITSTEVTRSTVKIRLWHSWKKFVPRDK